MRSLILFIGLLLAGAVKAQDMKPLTPEEKRVIVDKGTEAPFTGRYYDHREPGVYRCRQCGAALYRSQDKFDAGCGWPSFDDELPGAVKRTPDADGRRTEITCTNCGAHLGHVFTGEGFTSKNTRHCVNSVSLVFEPAATGVSEPGTAGEQGTPAPCQSGAQSASVSGENGTAAFGEASGHPGRAGAPQPGDKTSLHSGLSGADAALVPQEMAAGTAAQAVEPFAEPSANPSPAQAAAESAAQATDPVAAVQPKEQSETAIFAGGCFWGVEYMLSKEPGVLTVESGYTGGTTENPTYEQVCSHRTGHAEAVRVVFDPAKVLYEKLARLFFEIHDPTQENGQGPDLGDQYRSEIFYTTPAQQATAEKLIGELRRKGYDVVTEVTPAGRFWPAEEYHQRYYENKGTLPYCHSYTRRF